MRSICTSVVIAAASMLLVVPFATAADLEAEIADMKQRMEAIEVSVRDMERVLSTHGLVVPPFRAEEPTDD